MIDGDLVLFESSSAAERKFDFGDSGTAVISDVPGAMKNLERRIETIRRATKADHVVVALSCPTRKYFRHDILPTYKSNRTGPKPEAFATLREHLEANYRIYVKPRLEADDVLGILATHPTLIPGRKVIVSSDKDMRQIPGLHLNHNKLERGIVEITAEEGDRFHLYQTLIGDTIDGYAGCPGIGPVRANKILNNAEPGQQWAAVVSAFVRKGKTEADALVQARVARILRAEDWDFEKKEPRLWTPQ